MRRALRELVGLYWESGVSADIPALAWYLLSSLVPLALGLTALAAVVLGDYAEAQTLAARVSRVLPRDVHDQIVALVLRTKRDSPLLIAGAIVGMLWTSSGSVGVIDRCLSRMLSIKGSNPVLGKLRNMGVAFAVAGLVVVMVLLATAGTGLVDRLHFNATLVRLALPLLLLAVIVLICASVFRVLGGETVSWHAALAGGGVSGVILLITPTVAGYYTRWVANSTPVKVFLVLAGVLITCYIVAFGLLLGTGVVARVQVGHRLRAPESPTVQHDDAPPGHPPEPV
ncbi:MAG: YhjD/YihY/BrkB family envelope integrity protein [Solirubrobacteraceae bacterium]